MLPFPLPPHVIYALGQTGYEEETGITWMIGAIGGFPQTVDIRCQHLADGYLKSAGKVRYVDIRPW